MARFVYSALDYEGKQLTGSIEAPDHSAALQLLSGKYAMVTKVDAAQGGLRFDLSRLGLGGRVRNAELLGFTQNVAAMLESGMGLRGAMDIMLQDAENPALRRIIGDLSSELSSGNSLSTAMKKYPATFDKFYVSMVEAGEAGGNLPLVLHRVGEYLDRSENMRRGVKSALAYPLTIIIFAFIVVSVIVIFGVPRMEEMYTSLGAKLPAPTQIFLDFSKFLARNWVFAGAFFLAAGFVLRRVTSTQEGGVVFDRLKLRLYAVGPLIRQVAVARFARTLSTLYGSGVPIIQSLELVSSTMGNRVMEAVVKRAIVAVKEGESLTPSLRRSKLFPNMAVGMIAAGEETGSLEQMLTKVADFYESQVEATLKTLSSLLEPLIMIGVGIMLGGVIIVMGLPFINIASIL